MAQSNFAERIEIIGNGAFCRHMKDILEYRTVEYYRRRYTGESLDSPIYNFREDFLSCFQRYPKCARKHSHPSTISW
jgi:hypothetical protein